MPNINFKFDTDASKVERAIQRLGSEFDKVVNSGDKIDQSLIDFAALVDKNAGKVQNLTNEMKKLSAVNLQNMANQFRVINEGGFDQLLVGLRNIQTSTVGVEGAVENLITKLGLSKNSLQQIITQMRQALGNMAVGSQEYRATLSQINLIEQSLSRLDQSVSANAVTTVTANNNKITSTHGYTSVLQASVAQVQQNNTTILSNSLNTVNSLSSRFDDFTHYMMEQYFGSLKVIKNNTKEDIDIMINHWEKYGTEIEKVLAQAIRIHQTGLKGANNQILNLFRSSANPQAPAFTEFIKKELQELVVKLHSAEISYEEFVTRIQAININGLAAFDTIKKTVLDHNKNMSVDALEALKPEHPYSQINSFFDETKLSRASESLMAFALKTQDASKLTQNVLEQLKGKSELEVQAILNALQKLKQTMPIDSAAYKAATVQIGTINQEMQKTARANQTLAGGTSSATMAIQQMGFAVGDAGMITQNWKGALMGIGNNLPFVVQYIMEMNAAAKAAGTSGLKAFGAALIGPAGILLGVNAVIFAMQVLPDVLKAVGVSSNETAKSLKSTKEILKDLNVLMKESTLLGDDSTRSTLAEGVAFKELTARLVATTAGSKERKIVVDQIQASYPEYIKNIDLNKASEKDLTIWVNRSTAALYGKIKSMLLDKLIEKNADALVEASTSYKRALENNQKVKSSKDKGKNSSDDILYDKDGHILGQANMPSDAKAAENYEKRAKKELDQVLSAFKKNLTLSTSVVEAIMKSLGLNPEVANTDPDALKDYNKELKGDTTHKKGNVYTALEKMSASWDKIIAKETDAEKIAFLKYQKVTLFGFYLRKFYKLKKKGMLLKFNIWNRKKLML